MMEDKNQNDNQMSDGDIFDKTFEIIKERYDTEKVTLGHCISLMLESPSKSKVRENAGLTALVYFKYMEKKGQFEFLSKEDIKKMQNKIKEDLCS